MLATPVLPQQYRGKIGEKFTFACPAPEKESQIWGVETYTDGLGVQRYGAYDSSFTIVNEPPEN